MRKKWCLMIIVISLMVITTGCGTTEIFSATQINPIEKEEISVVLLNKGGSQQVEFTDQGMISEIIDNLNNIQVKKSSRNAVMKLLDNGNALNQESTMVIYLLTNNDKDISNIKSMTILLSEKDLYLPDVKSMQGGTYATSYINDSDETTLKSIKAIYSLADKNIK